MLEGLTFTILPFGGKSKRRRLNWPIASFTGCVQARLPSSQLFIQGPEQKRVVRQQSLPLISERNELLQNCYCYFLLPNSQAAPSLGLSGQHVDLDQGWRCAASRDGVTGAQTPPGLDGPRPAAVYSPAAETSQPLVCWLRPKLRPLFGIAAADFTCTEPTRDGSRAPEGPHLKPDEGAMPAASVGASSTFSNTRLSETKRFSHSWRFFERRRRACRFGGSAGLLSLRAEENGSQNNGNFQGELVWSQTFIQDYESKERENRRFLPVNCAVKPGRGPSWAARPS